MLEDKKEDNKEAVFNQSSFTQSRIHELFSKVDSCSNDLFAQGVIDEKTQTLGWKYDIAFNCLVSIQAAISSLLTESEQSELDILRKTIRRIFRERPPFIFQRTNTFAPSQPSLTPNYTNQDLITDALFQYRVDIERAMETHELGNPSKQSKEEIN